MHLSIPSTVASASAAVGVFMAVFAVRLARAPRWSHMVWYAGAAIFAAGYSLLNATMSMGFAPEHIAWCVRFGLASAGLHGICWFFFFARWERRRLERGERALVALGVVCVLLCLVPGAVVEDTCEHRTLALGLVYDDPVPGPLTNLVYFVYLGSIAFFARGGFRVARKLGGVGIPAGFVVIFVCAAHDVLAALRVVGTPYVLDLGFFGLVAGVGANITSHFVDGARELERYSVTLERTQRELVERERLAALGELAAVVAHEVRNPLAVVFNALAALRKTTRGSDTSASMLDIVEEEAHRLKRLVASLLDFARPYALDRERQDVTDVVAAAVALARAGRPARERAGEDDEDDEDESHEVRVEVVDRLAVDCDRLLLTQALANLVQNALQGEGRRSAVRVRIESDASRVRVAVIDDGPGVDAETAARLFQPFFTTRATGTGLGLALVKRIVEAHGGDVRHEPTPGRGATFVVTLPPAAERAHEARAS